MLLEVGFLEGLRLLPWRALHLVIITPPSVARGLIKHVHRDLALQAEWLRVKGWQSVVVTNRRAAAAKYFLEIHLLFRLISFAGLVWFT